MKAKESYALRDLVSLYSSKRLEFIREIRCRNLLKGGLLK
jgi:hypothetical protein